MIIGIVIKEANVVMKTPLAASSESCAYSLENITAVIPTGIAEIITDKPNTKGSVIKFFNRSQVTRGRISCLTIVYK